MLYNLGLALAQTGNTREAVYYLERARTRNPWFTPIYPVLIEAYRRLGDHARESELQAGHAKAVALGRVQGHLARAVQLDRQGRPAEAVGELKTALGLNPENPAALSFLGDVYSRSGSLDEALSQYQAALRLDPDLATAHYGLARVYQKRGQLAAARSHFEAYVRGDPASYGSWRLRDQLSRFPRNERP
jgi:tetratricopeptide (TPR) repeat protein